LDLKEIDADPVSVVAHKASQLAENVMVEDTSLEIEGASIGIHVRWLLDHLPDYIGRRAEWLVLLAVRKGDLIHIYKGSVLGTIVESRGVGFGFDPVFLPHEETNTLAESKPDHCSARALAVEALLQESVWKTHSAIKNWDGPWQKC
jgi:XTP/dITP diphosphohydrolase